MIRICARSLSRLSITNARYSSNSSSKFSGNPNERSNDSTESPSSSYYSPLEKLDHFIANDKPRVRRSYKYSKDEDELPIDKLPDPPNKLARNETASNDSIESPSSSHRSPLEKLDHFIANDKPRVRRSYKYSKDEDELPIDQLPDTPDKLAGNETTSNQSTDSSSNSLLAHSNVSKLRSGNLKRLFYSKEPVDGEPVPPAENRYINFKNPALNAFRPEGVDESKASFFLFPGQGSQFVGMGKNLLQNNTAKDKFKAASAILGYDLEEVCLQGPEEKLNQTLYAQPAVFVTSLAALEKFRIENPGAVENCIGTAGFSLGELTALVFSGAISYDDGLRLVKTRAEEMQKACEETTGGLMTVIYGNDAEVEKACKAASDFCKIKGIDPEYADCSVANYLFPHCKVVGGHLEALNFIQTHGKDFGIKRCKRIPVSGAFHTNLMRSAKKRFYAILNRTNIQMPSKIPVYSNFDGMPYLTKDDVIDKLPNQIHRPVKWQQIMFTAFTREQHEEHPWIFECGPGTNLITILKNVNARAYLKAKHIDV